MSLRISLPKETNRRVHELLGHFPLVPALFLRLLRRVVHKVPVSRHLRRVEQQRRVGGGILRPVTADGLDVAGIGDDGRVLLQ